MKQFYHLCLFWIKGYVSNYWAFVCSSVTDGSKFVYVSIYIQIHQKALRKMHFYSSANGFFFARFITNKYRNYLFLTCKKLAYHFFVQKRHGPAFQAFIIMCFLLSQVLMVIVMQRGIVSQLLIKDFSSWNTCKFPINRRE